MAAPTQEEITKVLESYDRGIVFSEYAESIIFEPVLISGTRYKYNICENNMYSEVESDGN